MEPGALAGSEAARGTRGLPRTVASMEPGALAGSEPDDRYQSNRIPYTASMEPGALAGSELDEIKQELRTLCFNGARRFGRE